MINKNLVPAVAGSSGLVGSFLIKNLAKIHAEVISLSRTEIDFENTNVINQIIDFDNLEKETFLRKIDHLYISLGTTIKKAGNAKNFEKVDYHYCLDLANLAFKFGVRRLSIVSSVGSNPDSKLLYPRTKGRIEKELAKIGFDHLSIMKPGIIMGKRKENRTGEKLAKLIFKLISPLLIHKLSKYKPIHANVISKAMINILNLSGKGIFELEYTDLIKFSKK